MEPPPPPPAAAPASSRSWSIYGRAEITQRYEILDRIGSGAYADVYRARRRSDGVEVALKEVHDYQSSLREIEALQALRGAPNVVDLIEYYWKEDEDAVLVLEFLPVDLAAVIRDAKKADGDSSGIPTGEVKQWMIQILQGVEACHRRGVLHRDLKPSNLLISTHGVLKLADFGQSRMLQETQFMSMDNSPFEQIPEYDSWNLQQEGSSSWPEEIKNSTAKELKPEHDNAQEPKPVDEDDYIRVMDNLKAKNVMYDTDKEMSVQDGDTSCLATCSTGEVEDDPFKGSNTYEMEDGGVDESGELTSCVGTRWFRAPELLYGSTMYGQEIDLWSLGCIFAELLSLNPIFPGISDIDQLGRIISILGNLTEETFPGCSNLPDYNKISFSKVENPIGLEAYLPNKTTAEVNLVKKLLCYNPADRATATQMLHDPYFTEEPLPVPVNESKIPSARDDQDENSPGEWADFRYLGSDSGVDEFGTMDESIAEKGFSIRFS